MLEFDHPHTPPFRVFTPAEPRVPFVFNSPHSGRHYPRSLTDLSRLSALQLRRSEDVFVDRLFASVVETGAPLLVAEFPRAWLDVNREPCELDPLLFAERLPAHANCRSMRVAGGLGTIPRLVAEGVPIYDGPLPLAEGLARIENFYHPYHRTLRQLINDTAETFGHAILVDCHSMPSRGAAREIKPRPDIIIGDRYGISCNTAITQELLRQFGEFGYSVALNKPYAGGFITEHYGCPANGLHAVQIEINRACYIDEKTLIPHEGFDRLKQDIQEIMAHLVSLPDGDFGAVSVAAE